MEVKDVFLLCYLQVLSILLFKRFFSFVPNFFVPKYSYSLYLSKDKIWRQSGKNVLPTKQNHSPVSFQITLSTYKQLRKNEGVVLIYAGGFMLVFCL